MVILLIPHSRWSFTVLTGTELLPRLPNVAHQDQLIALTERLQKPDLDAQYIQKQWTREV